MSKKNYLYCVDCSNTNATKRCRYCGMPLCDSCYRNANDGMCSECGIKLGLSYEYENSDVFGHPNKREN